MTSPTEPVAFLGIGTMGHAMASCAFTREFRRSSGTATRAQPGI